MLVKGNLKLYKYKRKGDGTSSMKAAIYTIKMEVAYASKVSKTNIQFYRMPMIERDRPRE